MPHFCVLGWTLAVHGWNFGKRVSVANIHACVALRSGKSRFLGWRFFCCRKFCENFEFGGAGDGPWPSQFASALWGPRGPCD
jgi:hypothetical protein